jgi:ADP-ribosylation factor GTPase-activating protein 2/3
MTDVASIPWDQPMSEEICIPVFQKLQAEMPMNRMCFDCNNKLPTWTTIPFGVYLCINCSASHRRMGVHITFVKSSDLDRWTKNQFLMMVAGGNQRAHSYFKGAGWSDESSTNRTAKYTSKAAKSYKKHLKRECLKQEHKDKLMSLLQGTTTTPKKEGLDSFDELKRVLSGGDVARMVGPIDNAPAARKPSARSISPKKKKEAEVVKKVVKPEVKKEAPKPKPAMDDDDLWGNDDMTPAPAVVKAIPYAKARTSKSLLSTRRTTSRARKSGLLTTRAKKSSSLSTKVKITRPESLPVREDVKPAASRITSVPAPVTHKPKPKVVKKYGGISSDSYFNREQAAPSTQKFSGSSAISSDQMFGRASQEPQEPDIVEAVSAYASDFWNSFQ